MCGSMAYIYNRYHAPLIIMGLKRLEYRGYDSTPIIEYTKEVICLDDFEVAIVKDGELTI